MHTFYIDVPGDYAYDWTIHNNSSDVLSIQYGVDVKFICNSYARRSEGDLYQVTVDDKDDELAFILKTGFTRVVA